MAPPGFQAVSFLIVRAYRLMGHKAELMTTLTASTFLLAAIMYVDDTDLLHWAPSATTSDEELIEMVQEDGNDWGRLAQVSGGSLKPAKYSLYLLIYKYVRGRARLKSLRDLPNASATEVRTNDGKLVPGHVTVLQPDGSKVYTQTHGITEASKMLDLHFSPCGNSKEHMEQIKAKGQDWVDGIRTRPLHRRDVWFSLEMKLYPAIPLGLVTVVLPPQKLENITQGLYFIILPLIGANRHITREWRLLPNTFQCLGIPDFVIIALAKKIHFLRCTWDDAPGNMSRWAYENFRVEVGLYGNPFGWDYGKVQHLATDGAWYKNAWELCDYLDVRLEVSDKPGIHPVRERDQSLIKRLRTMAMTMRVVH